MLLYFILILIFNLIFIYIISKILINYNLKKHKLRCETIIDISSIGTWEYYPKIDFVWTNDSYFKILGYDKDELNNPSTLNDVWIKFLQENDKKQQIELFNKFLINDKIDYYENIFQMKHKNNSLLWILSRGKKVSNKIVGIHIDITEEVKDQEMIEKLKEDILTTKIEFEKELLLSFINILELYDLYTKGHSENVAKLQKKIATKINDDESFINSIYWAGLVHDIGKLLVPNNILNKIGRLEIKEFEMIKEHPIWGYEVLRQSGSESIRSMQKIVLHHHERWDGKGYPDQLQEEQIPLGSRIIQIQDSFDAMSSDRSYRKQLKFNDIVLEIKNNQGVQFDPNLVEKFLEVIYE